jgi:hypothetical protein
VTAKTGGGVAIDGGDAASGGAAAGGVAGWGGMKVRTGVAGTEGMVVVSGGVCGGEKQPSTCGICRLLASIEARLLARVSSLYVLARFRSGAADGGDRAGSSQSCGNGDSSVCGDMAGWRDMAAGSMTGSGDGDESELCVVVASVTSSAVTQTSSVVGDE